MKLGTQRTACELRTGTRANDVPETEGSGQAAGASLMSLKNSVKVFFTSIRHLHCLEQALAAPSTTSPHTMRFQKRAQIQLGFYSSLWMLQLKVNDRL
jgi:hypothetical protein